MPSWISCRYCDTELRRCPLWIYTIHRIIGAIKIWREPIVLFTHGVDACEVWHSLIVASCAEVILIESVGSYQLLAAELERLSGVAGAEVGDDSAVGIVGSGLLYGSGAPVDHCAVVAEIVPRVVVEGDGTVLYRGVAAREPHHVNLPVFSERQPAVSVVCVPVASLCHIAPHRPRHRNHGTIIRWILRNVRYFARACADANYRGVTAKTCMNNTDKYGNQAIYNMTT